MSNSIRRSVLRGLGLAAATGGALLGAPVLAAPEAPTTAPYTVAQGFGSTVVDVVEVESVNGWYLTVGAGAVWPTNQNASARGNSIWNNVTSLPSGHVNFGGGFSVDGGIGYDFGAIRTELTYGYSGPSFNSFRNNTWGVTNDLSGKINKNDIMASVYWDVLPFSRFTPYIGGGIGYTNLSTPNLNVAGYNLGSANKGLFGWQAKVGVSYALAFNWDVYAEGTYSGAGSYTTDLLNFGSYNDFGAKLGFRYRFAQPVVVVVPEPAPAPAPAPAPIPAPEPAPEPIRGLW